MIDLMYITNNPKVAKIAQDTGVNRIFVDLETIGKAERQGGMNTVQSHHTLEDVSKIRNVLDKSKLLVRSNPIHNNSKEEIETIIKNGADIVMLPYFKTINEAAKFIDLVNGRAKVNLLVETRETFEKIDAILELEGIDEIHVGLNDLHLSYGMKFMFEVLVNGMIENIGSKVLNKGIKFGFGGIASLGKGIVPAEMIIKEHYRIGSTCAILSRSFCNTDLVKDLNEVQDIFERGIHDIRQLENEIKSHIDYFSSNKNTLSKAVEEFVKNRK